MNLFKKISIIFVCLNGLLFFNIAHAKAQYSHCEASYQYAWCTLNNGIMEYRNDDKTRIDCLTKTHAVEFDFAKKWAESVGQALYYSAVTGKRAKVVLIINQPREMMYLKRVEKLAKIYDFDFEYVTNAILKLDKDGRCSYCKCKCHKENRSECVCSSDFTGRLGEAQKRNTKIARCQKFYFILKYFYERNFKKMSGLS